MKKILVTGINGFAGQHLARELSAHGHEVYGTGNDPELNSGLSDIVSSYEKCDLSSPEEVAKLTLDGIEAVINLAGIAVNNPDEKDVERLININVFAHTNLYDRLALIGKRIRVIAVSSGAMYRPNQIMPLAEESDIANPEKSSAYIRSKMLMEDAVKKYSELDVVIARPFNHTGPGQKPGFLVPDWAERFIRGEELDTSRLDTWRDFTDVRDVVRAYRMLVESETLQDSVYNICSGVPRLGYDVISMLANEFETSLPEPRTEGSSVIYGSFDRIRRDIDWIPEIAIEKTIADFVKWRKAQN